MVSEAKRKEFVSELAQVYSSELSLSGMDKGKEQFLTSDLLESKADKLFGREAKAVCTAALNLALGKKQVSI